MRGAATTEEVGSVQAAARGDGSSPHGRLRVYLGAAPGVGKTYAMLDEGHRRAERGVDVVVGLVETHGRVHTAALLEGLEVVPRRTVLHRGATLTEMDVDAVLARRPALVLVDELAHTNAPGSRHAKRWQDVDELLAAGVDVVTTVNVQHLESLNDVVEAITGVRQQETVPDDVVRRADQIELVDMSPESLRRRLAHGNVYAAEKVDAALTQYFRVGNLTALRELALLWTADRVDEALAAYRREQGIDEAWPARERVVVAVTGGPETETLVRRGARIAQRGSGGELLALHVLRGDGLTGVAPDSLGRHRALVEQLGGSWHTVLGDDVAQAVLDFARGVNATQVLVGATRRRRVAAALSPGITARVIQGSGDTDVLVVTHEEAGRGVRGHGPRGVLSVRRVALAWALAGLGPPVLAALLRAAGGIETLPTVLMLFLALTVGVALVGGLRPALLSAVLGGLLGNFLFVAPLHTLSIAEPRNALAIAVLLAVAVGVSTVVDLAARRTVEAARARAEADTLTAIAGAVLTVPETVPAVLEQLRESLRLDGVALLGRSGDGRPPARWELRGTSAGDAPTGADDATATVPVDDDLLLALRGRTLAPQDVRFVAAVGQQLRAVVERDRLRSEARLTRAERERGEMRTALLAAVSHDLRTPLAAIKAGVTALRSVGDRISPADRDELLADVDHQSDRLQHLVDNLLDMSRLDAGALAVHADPVTLDEVVLRALGAVPEGAVDVDVPEELPLVHADAGLLERALANVVENAVRHSPPGRPVRVVAQEVPDAVVVRVVDHGPGVPDDRKDRMFAAFQRLGDAPRGHGLGLGLAVAQGFVRANGGALEAEDTPGGGLTMVLTLPLPGRGPGGGA
ncbi:sensor histidine kinase KdpD [Cellulomonas oligotrophica]|uniref:histidine kinase n=1 Tax=Cellulomonas oligotrophica TaxID=931536 RepID=A0A7Y9JZ80_9CELL|nr:sensor histidine kinase KdpD [Cellulomonas oligotrophica]NYD86509.1 two-component system sensor histidine kinase KdpD [Cellulomonas oligotrophica]